jgi:DNA-binding SARP family transcriptional activator
VSVLLLGPVIVGSTQRRLSPRSRSARGLLAMLALAEGQPVSPERLYQEVWGDRPSPSPIGNVQVAVHRLRRWLAECGADVRLETITGLYRLDFASETDVRRFRSLTALSARQDPSACYRTLEDALELWRGPALADASGPGATMAAVALERELTQATTRCAQAALEIGDPERALTIATARAFVDPLDEGIQAVLIDTLLATGQRAAALQTFECVRHRLATELGVDPGEALRQAHLRALHHTSCPNEISAPRPRQLPADIAEFTGRTSQLAVLREKLAQPAPVVMISGIPGVGKTTLAVHAAHLMKQDFPDGQLYAHLRGAGGHPSTPGDLLGQLLRALGREGSVIPADVGERAALFRTETADRKILVVLDNVADEAQVRPLLPGGAGCATLITSRQRLAALPGRIASRCR